MLGAAFPNRQRTRKVGVTNCLPAVIDTRGYAEAPPQILQCGAAQVAVAVLLAANNFPQNRGDGRAELCRTHHRGDRADVPYAHVIIDAGSPTRAEVMHGYVSIGDIGP